MSTYYVLYGLLIVIAIKGVNSRSSKYHLIAMGIIMTIFQGLRWNTGADWTQFYRTFNLLNWHNVFSFNRGDYRTLEYGYSLLNVCIKTLFGHYTFFLLLICGYINYTYGYFIQRYIPKYNTLCYYVILLTSELFPVRNTMAGVTIIWGIQFIQNRDFIRYALVVLAASLIHSSGALGIIFFWFNRRINKYYWLIAFLLSSIIVNYISSMINFMAGIPIIGDLEMIKLFSIYNDVYNTYGENVHTTSIFSFIMNGIILAMILFSGNNFKNISSKEINLFVNMAALSIVIGQMSNNANAIGELARLNYFVKIGFAIMLVLSLVNWIKRFKIDVSMLYVLLIAYSINRISGYVNDFYANLFIPYYSVFEHSNVRDFFNAF